MRNRTTIIILAIAATVSSFGAQAQQLPENQAYHQHRFFSAPSLFRGYQRIFYEACNRSETKSAFRWQGAGFGVDAFAPLDPGFCAYKNAYTAGDLAVVPQTVSFQGGDSGLVPTWIPCHEIFNADTCTDSLAKTAYGPYAIVEAMVSGPDGRVALSALSIRIDVAKDGSAKITIAASGTFEKVVIALPQSSLDPDDLRTVIDAADAGVDVIVDRFDKLRSERDPESSLLSDDVAEETASFGAQRPDGEDLDFTVSISDLAKLGSLFVVFGEVGGRITVRNEVVADVPS